MERLFTQEKFEEKGVSLEEENERIANMVIEEYPKLFTEMKLGDGTTAAVFYNDVRVYKEDRDLLPPYRYISLSKHGLTLFNTSCEGPLGYELTRKAIELLIELSDGQEVEDLLVSEWKNCIRNRINKGLIPLRKVLRTVTVTGKNIRDGVRGFMGMYSKTTL
jgi:hypothetical protein